MQIVPPETNDSSQTCRFTSTDPPNRDLPFFSDPYHSCLYKKQIGGSAGGSVIRTTDRCVRVQQGREEASPAPFNAAMDDWNMGIGSDIAIHFEEGNNIFVGRVVQMRKRYTNGRYVKYKRSVILHEDREKLGDLFVSCMFYTRVRSALSNTERVFKLKDNNTTAMNYKEYHVTTVVCPLNLTYHVATESYLLDATGDDIINTQLGGNTTWAIH